MSTLLTNPLSHCRNLWRQIFFRWLDKRHASSAVQRLGRRNLYIFPTRRGAIFLGFVIVLWMLGTNYQNNLILAFTFLLVSVFIVSILHTFANLAGIALEYRGAANDFAGGRVAFYFSVRNPRDREADGMRFFWQDHNNDAVKLSLDEQSRGDISVSIRAEKRGRLAPGRLCVESRYPLGLLRCWTWLRFEAEALVYPRPVEYALRQAVVEDDEGEGEHPVRGGEDFSGLKRYQPGDNRRRIAWKLYARERGLFTKEFSQNISRERWLDFFQVETQDTEARLSALCYWAIAFHQNNDPYGLILPGLKLLPTNGENHKNAVLEALAVYGR